MTQAEPSREQSTSRLRTVLVLTSVFLAAEVLGGLWTGSLALLADAGHMLTDVGGLALALLAIRFARRPPTPQRTYGYHRVEILAALANGILLVVISLGILYEAYQRLREPPAVASLPMLVIAGVGLAVNTAGALLLRSNVGESLNVKGAYFEVLADLLSSVGVIVASLVMMATGWFWVDPMLSAAIGLFILPRTWKLLAETFGILVEGTPPGVDVAGLRRELESAPGVVKIHDLHLWTITSGMYSLSAHALLKPGAALDQVREELRRRARAFKVTHATFEIEGTASGEAESHE